MRFLIVFLLNFFCCFAENVKISLWKTHHSSEFIIRFDIKDEWHLSDPHQEAQAIKFTWPSSVKIKSILWPKSEKIKTPFGDISGYKGRVECLMVTQNTSIPFVDIDVPICNDSMCKNEHHHVVCEKIALSHHENIQHSFLLAAFLAFLGGIILNFMPCVFPVLSLKIFSLMKKEKAWHHGLIFGLGVLSSFAVFVFILLTSRNNTGWGFHFQSPIFIQFLIFIFLILSLNLLGVFEMGLSLTRIGYRKAPPYVSSFLEGVLITVVSTPCTGPFMGTALASTLTAPTSWVIVIFMSLGLGVALPLMLVTFFPSWQSKLPKPGQWMITLKQFFGFCLLGTVVWLLSVYGHQTHQDSLIDCLWGVLFVSLGLWFYGAIFKYHLVKWFGTLLSFLLAFFSMSSLNDEKWEVYTPEMVQKLTQEKKLYFIDFTAKWCLICQVNKRRVLRTHDMSKFFKTKNITLFSADYTVKDKKIEEALNFYGRTGVPTYVAFDGQKVHVLNELLTQENVEQSFKRVIKK